MPWGLRELRRNGPQARRKRRQPPSQSRAVRSRPERTRAERRRPEENGVQNTISRPPSVATDKPLLSSRRAHFQDLGTRIAGFLDGVAAAADRGQKDLDRLTLAREILGVQLKGRRSTSRLPALVDLLLSKPLVSVPLAAKELKVSTQAVEGMIGELGATPRELTGRGRYRAWGIV